MAIAILFEDEDVTVGGDVDVVGTTSGDETIVVMGGTISFDASFNEGGDTIIFPGFSSDYFGRVEGSRFIISNGDFTVSIPLGLEGLTIQFDNVARQLTIDPESQTVFLGEQDFDTTGEPIDGTQGPPDAEDDLASQDEGESALAGNVLDNDSDPDGDELTVVEVDGDAGAVGAAVAGDFGTIVVAADGSYVYEVDADAYAALEDGEVVTETFTYTISDGRGGSDEAELVVTLRGGNDAPEAGRVVRLITFEDGPVRTVSGLGNVLDPEGDDLFVIPPAELPDGVTFNAATNSFSFNPGHPSYQSLGDDDVHILHIVYQVSDGESSAQARIHWEIRGVNDAATIGGDAAGSVAEDGVTTDGGTLTVDDPEEGEDAFDPASTGAQAGAYGMFEFDAATGEWDYALANESALVQGLAAGEQVFDTFTVRTIDGTEGLVTITVTGTNDAPTAPGENGVVTDEDTASAPVAIGAADIDGDALTYSIKPGSGPAIGTVTFDPAAGTFVYTPDANANGADSFTILVSDGNGGTAEQAVSVTVNPVNDAPVAVDDALSVDEDGILSFSDSDLTGNDSDADGDPLTVIILTQPTHGVIVPNERGGDFIAFVEIGGPGGYTYFPDPNFSGTDSFTYMVNDGTVNSNVATITITVNPVNDAPVSNDDKYSTDEDTALVIAAPGVLGNDSDVDGDPLTLDDIVSGPSHGTLAENADGSFTYTPDANFNGSDSFTYRANDGTTDGNVATVNITVDAVNDAPVRGGDASEAMPPIDEDSTPAGRSVSDIASGIFSDATDDQSANGGSSADALAGIAIHVNNSNANGQWQYSTDGTSWTNVGSVSVSSALLLSSDSLLRFLPAADFNGEAPTLAFLLVEDSGGAITSGDYADATVRGGTSAISAEGAFLTQTVNPVDEPVEAVAWTIDLSPGGSPTQYDAGDKITINLDGALGFGNDVEVVYTVGAGGISSTDLALLLDDLIEEAIDDLNNPNNPLKDVSIAVVGDHLVVSGPEDAWQGGASSGDVTATIVDAGITPQSGTITVTGVANKDDVTIEIRTPGNVLDAASTVDFDGGSNGFNGNEFRNFIDALVTELNSELAGGASVSRGAFNDATGTFTLNYTGPTDGTNLTITGTVAPTGSVTPSLTPAVVPVNDNNVSVTFDANPAPSNGWSEPAADPVPMYPGSYQMPFSHQEFSFQTL